MRVAIIVNTSWNIYNFRKGIVKHFIEAGHRVLAIAPQDAYSERLIDMGCEYRPLPISGSGMNPVSDFFLTTKLWKILKEECPDILFTYTIKPNIYGSIVSGILGIPCICNVSGLGTVFLWKGWVRRFASALYSFSFKYNSWVFFQNQDDRKEFLDFVRLKPDKTSLVPGSGIDLNYFRPQATPVNPVPRFLMISRLLIDKGVAEYVMAAREFLNQGLVGEFWLVGDKAPDHKRSVNLSEFDEWLQQGIFSYQPKVDDIRSFIASCDVVVLPSYREGTPRTLLEAAAMGKPLITTDVPGCVEVVEHGKNGLLCKSKDPKSLFNALAQFNTMSISEREKMGERSRIKVEKEFDEKIVVSNYANKTHELLGDF